MKPRPSAGAIDGQASNVSLPVYPEHVLAAALAHARAAVPEEACGLVVRHRDGSLCYRPIENAADRFRAADPAVWPWSARESFVLSPGQLAEVLSAVGRGDMTLVATVHSHPLGGAALSALDRAGAIDEHGWPVLPVIEQLVIGLSGSGGPAVRAYHHEAGEWAARGLPIPSELPSAEAGAAGTGTG